MRAPFAGIVSERYLDPGALVSGGGTSPDSRIAHVAQTHPLRCVVDAPDIDVRSLAVGRRATIRVAELPERTFEGTVTRVAGALQPQTRTMRAEITVPNPAGTLKPGMYCHVDLDLDTRVDVLTLPAGAVTVSKKGAYVVVVVGGRARKVAVETGYDDGVRTEIVSGLTGRERVILVGKDQVAEGDPVLAAPAPPELLPGSSPSQAGGH